MHKLLSIAAFAVAAITLVGTAEAAKRRGPVQQSASSATAASAFDVDPSKASGGYPDWARRALAPRGSPGK